MILIYQLQLWKKIIEGTKEITLLPLIKSIREAVVGKSIDDDDSDKGVVDMFELEDIKEIANYLIVYYESHKSGD